MTLQKGKLSFILSCNVIRGSRIRLFTDGEDWVANDIKERGSHVDVTAETKRDWSGFYTNRVPESKG